MKTFLSILFVCFSLQLLQSQEATTTEELIIEMKDADTQPMYYASVSIK
jgi:hypothetical protein